MNDEVERIWSALSTPGEGLQSRRHPDSDEVWLAVDSSARRHLLVRASAHEPGTTLITTRGLQAEMREISVERATPDVWADIACTDRSLDRAFLAVAADLVADTRGLPDPLEGARATLRTWQWFWGVDRLALSGSVELGLFGEMWFLDRWAPFPAGVEAWHGADAERHDVAGARMSVEVKTTRSHGTGPPRHHIATLDQLDLPPSGRLFLFSLQAIPETTAGNTLTAVITRLRNRLSDRRDVLEGFDKGLAKVGWTPAAEDQPTTYRVAAERLYRVGAGFPRITRRSFPEGIPDGVDDIGYSLDLAACGSWLVATSPETASTMLSDLT